MATTDTSKEQSWLGKQKERWRLATTSPTTDCKNKNFQEKNWGFLCLSFLFFLPAISFIFNLAVGTEVSPARLLFPHRVAAPPHSPGTSRGIMSKVETLGFRDIPQQTALMRSRLTSWPRAEPADTLRAPTGSGELIRCDMLRSGFSQGESGRRRATPSLRCDWNHDFLSTRVFPLTSIVGPSSSICSLTTRVRLRRRRRTGEWANMPRKDSQRLYWAFQGDFTSCLQERLRVEGGKKEEIKKKKQHFALSKKGDFRHGRSRLLCPRRFFRSVQISLCTGRRVKHFQLVFSCTTHFTRESESTWPEPKLSPFVLQPRCCWTERVFMWTCTLKSFHAFLVLQNCIKCRNAVFYILVMQSNMEGTCRAAVQPCKWVLPS